MSPPTYLLIMQSVGLIIPSRTPYPAPSTPLLAATCRVFTATTTECRMSAAREKDMYHIIGVGDVHSQWDHLDIRALSRLQPSVDLVCIVDSCQNLTG